MARKNWRNNAVISLKLRNKKYVLIQLLATKGKVLVFNIFREVDTWNDVDLNSIPILFTAFIHHNSIFSNSEIDFKKKIKPLENVSFPNRSISLGLGTRKVKLWEGTEEERELIFTGEGNNLLAIEKNETKRKDYHPIAIEDYEKFKGIELSGLRIYPEFNERLKLCSELNNNFDPMRELAFNRQLDLKCKTYIDIISGKVKLKTLGY